MQYIHAAALFAAEEAEGGGGDPLDLILPATAELVWGVICFLIVLYVLWKKAFPAIRSSVEAREQRIAEDLEAAERAKNEAENEKRQYQQQIAESRSEANRIVDDARQQAEQVRKDIIAKAEKEAEQITARAQESIEAERASTIQELQSTIATMSIQLAEKVVGRSIDASAQKEMVDAYIRDVGAMGNGSSNN